MSKYNESIRSLLEDICQFLITTLQHEDLSESTKKQKDELVNKIKQLYSEYPALSGQLVFCENAASQGPASPHPYLSMTGANNSKLSITDYVLSDPQDDLYEICEDNIYHDAESSFGSANTDIDDSAYGECKDIPAVGVSDLQVAIKSGYLEKRGKGLFSTCQRRWCAVQDGIFYYFSKNTDKKQCGSICLNGYEARPDPSVTKDASKKDCSFELVCPGKRSYQFVATSLTDMQEWILAIENSSKKPTGSSDINQRSSSTEDKLTSTKAEVEPNKLEDSIYETLDDVNSVLKNDDGGSDQQLFDTYDVADAFNKLAMKNQAESKYLAKNSHSCEESTIGNPEEWYTALWDCSANEPNELEFKRGDLIHISNKEYDNLSWWIGELQGQVGFVPKTYLTEAYELVGEA